MTCELIQGKKKHKKTHKKSEKNHTKLLFKKIRVRQNSERLVVEIFLRKKTSLYFFPRLPPSIDNYVSCLCFKKANTLNVIMVSHYTDDTIDVV